MRNFVGVDKVSYDYCGVCGSEIEVRHGITKREYFAAMAMQGFISCGKNPTIDGKNVSMVDLSFAYADAMLAESEKSDSDK